MSGRNCLQHEINCSNKEITGGLLPFSTRATLIRNQRFFLINARPKSPGIIFLHTI